MKKILSLKYICDRIIRTGLIETCDFPKTKFWNHLKDELKIEFLKLNLKKAPKSEYLKEIWKSSNKTLPLSPLTIQETTDFLKITLGFYFITYKMKKITIDDLIKKCSHKLYSTINNLDPSFKINLLKSKTDKDLNKVFLKIMPIVNYCIKKWDII